MNGNCKVCNLFTSYAWDIGKIDTFNKFLKDEVRRHFTDYQLERLKFEFNISVMDISFLTTYAVKRHLKDCPDYETLALTLSQHEPEDFITRKESRELIANFRKLDYNDKKNVLAQNWLEVILLLTASTKKTIERNLKNNPENILSSKDIKIAQLVSDTFKIPSFEVVLDMKVVKEKDVDRDEKYRGKLKEIESLLSKN